MARRKATKSQSKYFGYKGGMSTMTVGTIGAVVGGALGAAGAIMLADQQKRQMVGQKFGRITTYAADAFEEYAPKGNDYLKQVNSLAKKTKLGKKRSHSKTKS